MDRLRDALFHDGTGQFRKVDETAGQAEIILRTAKNTIKSVSLRIDDKRLSMHKKYSDCIFDFYSARVSLSRGQIVRYYFQCETESGDLIYYDKLGANDEADSDRSFEYTMGFKTPDWAKGAVMYQIFVDRFCKGDDSNSVCTGEYAYIDRQVRAVRDWYSYPEKNDVGNFYGGDLRGVINKMDYLKNLGVEVIYFNPLFVSPSNHKYDIQDYDHIDPHFGVIRNDSDVVLREGDLNNEHAEKYKIRTTDVTNLELSNRLFVELVQEAHKRDMKVILDGVFNHCGSFNKWIDREKIYRGNKDYHPGAYEIKESKYNNYFKFKEDKWPDNDTYEGWWDHNTLPKLNYDESTELVEEILRIGEKWVSPPYNADGWRLDVAADLGHSPEFNHSFWRTFRDRVKKANPDAIILAEHYGDAHSWLMGDQWDTVMNYDAFMEPVTWFLTGMDKHSDSSNFNLIGDDAAFNFNMNHFMSQFQTESLQVAMNQLSNHDHSRFLTRTNKTVGRIATVGSERAGEGIDEAIFRQGVVMQMTLPGAPTIYYGDEAGVCGWTDPDNRRTYPWGRENLMLLEFYREAITMHKKNQVFKTGSYMSLSGGAGYVCYGRFDESGAAVTAVNTGDNEVWLEIPVWRLGTVDGQAYERIMETTSSFYNCGRVLIRQEQGNIKFKVQGRSSVVYRSKEETGWKQTKESEITEDRDLARRNEWTRW